MSISQSNVRAQRSMSGATGLSPEDLKALALELCAALPPPESEDPGERELLQIYRLLDANQQAATRRFLSAMV
ncbi:TPA: hypothetical protein ACGW13_000153 [Stenotrophomonas maltophilia]